MCLSNRMYSLGIDSAGLLVKLHCFTGLNESRVPVGARNVETCGLLADS